MKLHLTILSMILLLLVACSPTADTTAPTTDNDNQVNQVIEVDTQLTIAPTEPIAVAESNDELLIEPIVNESADTDPIVDNTNATVVGYEGPAWTNLPLVDANTGATFTLANFAGKTVFVEPMATWCSNCRSQQGRISEVISQLSPDDYVVLSLSVETYLVHEELADYSANYGFNWTFAVASEDLLSALVTEFGRGVSSPPSVPHFTISPDGTVGNFATGPKSGDEFLALVRSVSAES